MGGGLMVLDGPIIWLMFALLLLLGVPLGIVIGVIKLRSAPQSMPQPPSPVTVYQVSRDGRVIGAYDTVALRHLICSGAVQLTDDYWSDGMPSWQKVGSRRDWLEP